MGWGVIGTHPTAVFGGGSHGPGQNPAALPTHVLQDIEVNRFQLVVVGFAFF